MKTNYYHQNTGFGDRYIKSNDNGFVLLWIPVDGMPNIIEEDYPYPKMDGDILADCPPQEFHAKRIEIRQKIRRSKILKS